MESREENLAYLYYKTPVAEHPLAETARQQGIEYEIWTIEEGDLQAHGLQHTASGHIAQIKGNAITTLRQDFGNQSCAVSSTLASSLFGSRQVIGKQMLYHGKPYTIMQVIPNHMPILFLGQNILAPRSQTQADSALEPQTAPASEPKTKADSALEPQTAPASEPKTKADSALGSASWKTLSIATVHNMQALDYKKTESLFQNSDAKIDINLLKWTVYLIVFLLFLGRMASFSTYIKKPLAKWAFLLLSLCFFKVALFPGLTGFPTWSLPGAWSNLEGWGALWETVFRQAIVILQFQDYPIVHNYFQALLSCPLYLIASLLFWGIFVKKSTHIARCPNSGLQQS